MFLTYTYVNISIPLLIIIYFYSLAFPQVVTMEKLDDLSNPFEDFLEHFKEVFDFGSNFELDCTQGLMENHFKQLCKDYEDNKGIHIYV